MEELRKSILEKIDYLYRDKQIDLCLLYGSKDPKTDLDLLIVFPDDTKEGPRFYENLDITEISVNFLHQKLNLFDIVYTEPFLEGELLIGDPEKNKTIIQQLNDQKATNEALEYLKRQAIGSYLDCQYFRNFHAYNYAYEYLKKNYDLSLLSTILDWNQFQASIPSNEIWFSIINLAYAVSYIAIIKHFAENPNVVTLRELLEDKENSLLAEIIKYKKNISRNKKKIDLLELDNYREKVKKEIIGAI